MIRRHVTLLATALLTFLLFPEEVLARQGSKINVTSPVDAMALARLIAGPGLVVTGAQLLCARPEQAGIFDDFFPEEPAVHDDKYHDDASIAPAVPPLAGAVIGNAFADDCGGSDGVTDDTVLRERDELNGTGSSALDGLLPSSRVTEDACILHIDFICPLGHDRIGIQYVFGSNNYPSNGTTPNEDLMGAFVNGRLPRHNVARAPLSSQNSYVSVNTLFSGVNYIDNQQRLLGVDMNGFTKTISSVGRINQSGSNFMEVMIADGGSRTRRNLRNGGGSRELQVVGNQAGGSWVFLTTSCMTCIHATDLSASRGVTSVRSCAQMAATTARCKCSWACMLSAIKRMCVFTGTTASFNTYVSQVRTNINARFCRR